MYVTTPKIQKYVVFFFVGVPVDNTALYLLNDKRQMVEPGCLGELYVAGANVAGGYVNNRDPHRFIENVHPHNGGRLKKKSLFQKPHQL